MNDKMREEFEAWVKQNWPNQSLDQFNNGEYQGFTLNHCWDAWKASRAALVIELPTVGPEPEPPEEAIDDSYMDAHHATICMRNRCYLAIEDAGLKVAP